MGSVEIICKNCGAETWLQREAIYEGFIKNGEQLTCSACGYQYASEQEVPFKAKVSDPPIFTEADLSARVEVFAEGENKQLCRHCAYYIVNPFTQFCANQKREVQATDRCNAFSERGKNESPPPLF